MISAKEYDPEEYKSNPVISKPFLKGYPLLALEATKSKLSNLNMQKHYLQSDERLLSLGFRQREDSFLTFEESQFKAFSMDYGFMYRIYISLDMDAVSITR